MIDALRRTLLFAHFDDASLEKITALAHPVQVRRGQIIVQQGEPGGALYLILKGMVKICAYTPDGREVVFALLGPGSFFGEMALLDGKPRSASAYALEFSELVRIRREDFQRLLLEQPKLALRLLETLADRLRTANRRLAEFGSLDAPHRVYAWLLEHAHRFGAPTSDGRLCMKLPAHQLIADQISTSRETVSRVIAKLKRDGVLAATGRRREVAVDAHALAEMVESVQ